jgi:hypothetical protein
MEPDLDSAPHCERDDDPENCEIEITPEMIEAGLQFLRDEAMPSLTARAASPAFVEGFIRSVYKGRHGRK